MESTKTKKKKKRFDLLFLLLSMKINVKIEGTSDDRKQRRVCKAFDDDDDIDFPFGGDEKGGPKDDEN